MRKHSRIWAWILTVSLVLTGVLAHPVTGYATDDPSTTPPVVEPVETPEDEAPEDPEPVEGSEEDTDPEPVEVPDDETPADPIPEPVEGSEDPTDPEPVEGAEEEEPVAEPFEAPEDEDLTDPEPVEGSEEDTDSEPVEEPDLPEGINGMPEGYELTAYELQAKADIAAHDVVGTLNGMVSGVDYVADYVFCHADSYEHAEMIAYAYNGTLIDFSYGAAQIALNEGMTVEEAVAIGADADIPVPAVEPDYYIQIEPSIIESTQEMNALALNSAPVMQTWESFYSGLEHPDRALDPTSPNYQWMHSMINSYGAWAVDLPHRNEITVAVIDTGVNINHEELTGHSVEYSLNSTYGTGDSEGHGTHVAGIISATINNSTGGAGVAPGVKILSIRVADQTGNLNSSAVRNAIYYVAGNNSDNERKADIINLSLGGPGYSALDKAAIEYANENDVTICAAMSNDTANAQMYPAAYNHVIAVAAVNETGAKASFSNWGKWADIAAPGTNIYSTYYSSNSAYAKMGGTSMACPVVAGACALYMMAYGHVSPATMEAVLKRSVNKSSSSQIGAGIIDVSKMFTANQSSVKISVEGGTGDIVTEAKGGATVTSAAEASTSAKIKMEAVRNGSISEAGGMILYTTNGKNPAVLNGEIKSGEVYPDGGINISTLLSSNNKKQTITVKAAWISETGVMCKVTTLKVTVNPAIPETIEIADADQLAKTQLIAGKSLTLSAKIAPATASKSVKWEITNWVGTTSKPTINASSGKITTKANQSGTLTVICKSTTNGKQSAPVEILVGKGVAVNAIKLNQSSGTLLYYDAATANEEKLIELEVTTLTRTGGYSLLNGDNAPSVELAWSTSNPKVATVIPDATNPAKAKVTATGKGTAKITVKTLDGSGKSATCNITVKQMVTEITVDGQSVIAGGTSATFKADARPSTANTRTVTWSIEGKDITAQTLVDSKSVTVNAKGKVTVGNVPDDSVDYEFIVKAEPKEGSGKPGEMKFKIVNKAESVKLYVEGDDAYKTARNVTYNKNNVLTSARIFTTDVPVTGGDETTIELTAKVDNDTEPKWTSSNAKVATVTYTFDETAKVSSATITAVKKGTTTITCAAQDGSGKKATIKITVAEPAKVTITGGQQYIAKGTSTTFKASCAVNWSIKNGPVNGVDISTKGKVTVGNESAEELEVTIVATAKDGSGGYGEKVFRISKDKIIDIQIAVDDEKPHNKVSENKNGTLAAAQIFTYNVKDSVSADETQIKLSARLYGGTGESSALPLWTSSNEKVAQITTDRESKSITLKAVSAGTTTITCAAQDGSGKKATMKLNVIVPASGLTLVPKTEQTVFVGYGKSATVVTAFGDAYGKPSNTKVTWDYDLYAYKKITDSEGYVTYKPQADALTEEQINELKSKKLVTIKNGKVTIAKKAKWDVYNSYLGDNYGFGVTIKAYTADGTGLEATYQYHIVKPASYVKIWWNGTRKIRFWFGSYPIKGWWDTRSATYSLSKDGGATAMEIETDMEPGGYKIVSSNPSVVSASMQNGSLYVVFHKKGSAKITVTALDGSGKSAKLTIKVTK